MPGHRHVRPDPNQKKERVIANSRRVCDNVCLLMGSQMSTVTLHPPHTKTLVAFGLLFATSATSSATAGCPVSPEDVVEGASDVIFGFERGPKGADRLDAGRLLVESGVVCLGAAPMPYDAALVYQANALIRFMAMDDAEASLWLRAMSETMPSLGLSAEAAPPSGALDSLYQAARSTPTSPRAPVKIPKDHTLYVDGQRTTSVPLERPSLVVLTNPDGRVVWSGLVRPGDNLEATWTEFYPPRFWPPLLTALGLAVALVAGGLAMAPNQMGGRWSP